MNILVERPSARIFQFPPQPRLGTRFGAEADPQPVRIAGFGDSWYHEDAVRESERAPSS